MQGHVAVDAQLRRSRWSLKLSISTLMSAHDSRSAPLRSAAAVTKLSISSGPPAGCRVGQQAKTGAHLTTGGIRPVAQQLIELILLTPGGRRQNSQLGVLLKRKRLKTA